MKFSKETVEILQNFSQINQGMQFRKGTKQSTVAITSSIIGFSEFDIDIPQSFAIYDLSKFLGILSLIDDPNVEIEDQYAIITGGDQKVKYRFAEPKMIVSWPEDKRAHLASVDSSFELSKEVLSKLTKSSNLLDVEHVMIESTDGKVRVRTFDPEDAKSSTASFKVGEADNNYKMIFKIKTMPIMTGDYLVEICRNKMTRWTNKSKNVHYYIPADKASTFE